MIIFVLFLRASLAKNISKNGVFLPYFDIFWGKYTTSSKRNLVEFVTSDIFKLYMSNKVDRLVQKCSKLIFKCFIPQIVPNGTMRVE